RNLGDLVASIRSPGGNPVNKPRLAAAALGDARANSERTMVPPSEGNEARRDERRGVRAPRCTCDAGGPTRGTPPREGGAEARNRWRERGWRHRAPRSSLRNSIG